MSANSFYIRSTLIILLVGIALAAAGSHQSQLFGTVPIYAICIALAFVINWAVFLHANANQTEKYFDLTGAVTNSSMPIVALLLSPMRDMRSIILTALVVVWAGRLGLFLFGRIRKAGHDDRFDRIKTNPWQFFMTWSLQALWGSFSLAAALVGITSTERSAFGIIGVIGLLVWLLGFGIEVVADNQKTAFRSDPANRGKFIHTGLWAWSRHPNYFGEIVLWIGVTIIALPVMVGWQYVTLISPIFVIVLLMRISGVPMLEAKADKKWGGQPAYEAYKANTPVLVPRPPLRQDS